MPPGKYRPERDQLVDLHVTVRPSTRTELEVRAAAKFGTSRAIGRMIDEDYMSSRPFEPTNEQRKSRFLVRAYADRCTEEETIERLFRELERAKDGYPDEPEPGEKCSTCGRTAL